MRELLDNARLSRLTQTNGIVPRQYRTVVNWGNTRPLTVRPYVTVLNKPENVAQAVNKVAAFLIWKEVQELNIPEFKTSTLTEIDGIWLARTNPMLCGGRDIVVLRPGDTVVRAPLYTKYIPKLEEYRVHVVNKKAIFVQQKLRASGRDQTKDEKLIRNHNNGWVFCLTDSAAVREDIKDAAIMAVDRLGLDFGAVDILIGRDCNRPFVLECNTAPGLSSPSLCSAYKEAFQEWLTQ